MNSARIDFSAATKVYVGSDSGCRCGCKGKYHEAGTPGFLRALKKAAALEADDVCSAYANFPYGNNRAVCVYFS